MQTLFRPDPGHVWNPLRNYRNVPCPCGSGKKAKRCHGKTETLTIEDAGKAIEYIARLEVLGFIEAKG